MEKFDVTVIGSGPGGYIAAVRASQLGMRVALVEKKELGGLCVNLGCIPSKAILKAADLYNLMKHAADYGLRAEAIGVEYDKVVARSRRVAERLSRGVQFLMKKHKVAVFPGSARLGSATRVLVDGNGGEKSEFTSDHVILATGTEPRGLPGLPVDGKRILFSDEAIVSPDRPSSVAVIGGGAVGVEFAYWYNAFGSRTTIIEIADQLLPATDKEIVTQLARSFKKQGITTLTSSKVESAKQSGEGVELWVSSGATTKKVDADLVLVAIGRKAVVAGLGLEEAGVDLKDGYVRVDENYRTTAPSVYAIGDVNGPPLLAHAASAEGVAAVEKIAGVGHGPVDPNRVPSCIYAQPEVATIGLTEEQARDRGIEVKVGRFPFRASGRAIASGEEDGLVKLVADARYGEILGAHIVGKGATELIAEIGLARTLEATAKELHATVHAHPTLAEMIGEAALDLDGMTLNI
jgi:dihydrolipoamide dehydrogenase